jgi:hypothetical protein
MRLRSLGLAATALLIVSMPVHAQDPTSTVSFDGVGFTFDRALGESVSISRVPGEPPDRPHVAAPSPRHLAFTLFGPRAESARVPRPIDAGGVVRVYRTEDLPRYAWASGKLEELESLLAARPDLATRTALADDGGIDPLPFVADSSAAQAIIARAQYVDTPDLSGIAYLTVFRQDVFPFAAADFWYTFQGLSDDGEWYVAVDFIIEAGMFPERVTARDARRVSTARRWADYVNRSLLTLNEAAPDAFTPPLSSIDALVRSITFPGISGPETSPSPEG